MIRLLASTAACTLILLAAVAPAEQPPDPRVKGERVFLKCFSCHTLNPGAAKLPGPDLVAIIGRKTAAQSGFAYSEAMQRFAARNGRWTASLLDRYIADPEQIVPGTSMAFPGIRDANERKELLDYLRNRSRTPS
jgi:cytochrome c